MFGLAESDEERRKTEATFEKLASLCFKNGNTWIVGDEVSLADLELAVRLSMITEVGQYDMQESIYLDLREVSYDGLLRFISGRTKKPSISRNTRQISVLP